MRLCTLVAVAAMLSASLVARAESLIGSTVDVRFLYPNASSTYEDFGPQTVTPGLTDDVGGLVDITFGTDTITITNPYPGGFTADRFNGFDIAFLSGFTVDSVSYDPSSSSLFAPGSKLTSTSSTIKLNLANTCDACEGGETITLDVAGPTSVTPEPSTFALLGTALLGVATQFKRRLV